MTSNSIPDHSVIEWFAQPSSIYTGIVGNVEPVRHVGCVSFTRPNGKLAVADAASDGNGLINLDPERVTAVLESNASARDAAGWLNRWAR